MLWYSYPNEANPVWQPWNLYARGCRSKFQLPVHTKQNTNRLIHHYCYDTAVDMSSAGDAVCGEVKVDPSSYQSMKQG